MRTLKSNRLKEPRFRKIITCRCNREFEIQSGDERNFKLVFDPRDSNDDYYEIPCPECKATNIVVARLFS